MKYDQSIIDKTLDEAFMLFHQGKNERAQTYALLSIAMMMRNNQDGPAYTLEYIHPHA
jgi:hypothetical protein